MEATSYESIVVSNVAIGFTSALLLTAPLPIAAYLTVEDAGVAGLRFRIDGVNPTAIEGHPLYGRDNVTISSMGDISKFRAIRAGGADVTIRVTYFAM